MSSGQRGERGGTGGHPGFLFHRSTPEGTGGVARFELLESRPGSPSGGEAAVDRAVRAAYRGRLPASPGGLRLGRLVDGGGETIDDEVVLSRSAPGSTWSGLASWNLDVHGGPWVQSRVAERLHELGGEEIDLRGVLREAVERRALDAIQAAAYEALIGARTDLAAEFFLRQHRGELSGILRRCADRLEGAAREADRDAALAALEALLSHRGAAVRLRDPLRLLIAGPPNVGKSTLFNALARGERVLVSSRPGTTRDSVEELIEVDGFPVRIVDSAGIRSTPGDPVEREAIARVGRLQVDAALWLVGPPWTDPEPDPWGPGLRAPPPEGVLRVESFEDLRPGGLGDRGPAVRISALRRTGLDALEAAISGRWLRAGGTTAPGAGVPAAPFLPTQIEAIERAADALRGSGTARDLDDVRGALVHCVGSSWPDGATASGSG